MVSTRALRPTVLRSTGKPIAFPALESPAPGASPTLLSASPAPHPFPAAARPRQSHNQKSLQRTSRHDSRSSIFNDPGRVAPVGEPSSPALSRSRFSAANPLRLMNASPRTSRSRGRLRGDYSGSLAVGPAVGIRRAQSQRRAADRFQVRRDLVAGGAVTPRAPTVDTPSS